MKFHSLNDHIFKKALVEGDESAFAFLFDMLYKDLVTYILSFTNNIVEAEEIVQKTFIKYWKKRNSIQVNTSVKAYFYKSSYHEFIDFYRKEKHLNFTAIEKYNDIFIATDEPADDELKPYLILEEAIEQLPTKSKEIFKLHKLEGKSYQQIADLLDISKKTVENHLWKAYKKLKEYCNSAIKN
ncbi:RNA polymerase sigma factor [Zhouia sp. PK063]|uniref:RNA polymerase sigma factor n=1 Tax=Zhouia sp. PK063 TaxID=3373602 RepID=UPI00378B2B73